MDESNQYLNGSTIRKEMLEKFISENIHCEAIFSESSGINDEEPNTKQPLSLYLVFSNDKLQ